MNLAWEYQDGSWGQCEVDDDYDAYQVMLSFPAGVRFWQDGEVTRLGRTEQDDRVER